MKYKVVLLLILFLLICETGLALNSRLNHIQYRIGGDGKEINNIQLMINYKFDYLNLFNINFLYDGNDINYQGVWQLNFINRPDLKLNFELAVSGVFWQRNFSKGLGLSIKGPLTDVNDYFLKTGIYIGDQRNLLMEGGVIIPVYFKAELTLSVGNLYWDPSRYLINLGIKMDF